MDLRGSEGEYELRYSRADVLNALETCVGRINGFRTEHGDKERGVIHVRAGVSRLSWGEDITVSVSETQGGNALVSIFSRCRVGLFGWTVDWGKNRMNIDSIAGGLLEELSTYHEVRHDSPA